MSAKIDQIEPKEHFIEIDIKEANAAFDQEFNKAWPNHMTMLQLARNIFILLKCRANNFDAAHSERLTVKAEFEVHEVKNTYNPLKSMIVTCLTVTFHVGSGALGIAGAFQPALAAGAAGVDIKGRLEGISKGLGAGAGASETIGRIFSESSSAQRTVAENRLRETQRRRDERDNIIRQDGSRLNDTLRDSKEAIQGEHQAKQQVTG